MKLSLVFLCSFLLKGAVGTASSSETSFARGEGFGEEVDFFGSGAASSLVFGVFSDEREALVLMGFGSRM